MDTEGTSQETLDGQAALDAPVGPARVHVALAKVHQGTMTVREEGRMRACGMRPCHVMLFPLLW